MLSLDEIYDKIEQGLLHKGTTYLYTLQGEPKIIQLNEIIGKLSDINHHWKTKEHRFGEALMITKICTDCYYGEIEVFPSSEYRKVSKN